MLSKKTKKNLLFTVKLQLQWKSVLLALKWRITSFYLKFSDYTVSQGPIGCC